MCGWMDNGMLVLSDVGKKEAWKNYHVRVLNAESEWDNESFPHVNPIERSAVR